MTDRIGKLGTKKRQTDNNDAGTIIRSVIGFLVMFGGMGLYYYLLHKERKPASVYMKKTRSENKKR